MRYLVHYLLVLYSLCIESVVYELLGVDNTVSKNEYWHLAVTRGYTGL